jgi:hypothetical protein
VPCVIVDDHLLRDVLTGNRGTDLDGLATALATTGLWLFRLCSSLTHPNVVGKLSAPVIALPEDQRARFIERLIELPEDIEVLTMRGLAWPMAQLQRRHRDEGRPLSAAMVEALAAAHRLGASLAVSRRDVGANLKASAERDGIPFHIL